jgi:hypothetical protein
MTRSRFALAIIPVIFLAGPAAAKVPHVVTTPDASIEVHSSVVVAAAPTDVWAKIGDFCAIQQWLPGIVNCDRDVVGPDTYRTLHISDDSRVMDHLLEATPQSYTYEMVDSRLPVTNFRSTFAVKADGDGTMITWDATFDARVLSPEKALAAIQGIYEEGLNSIAAMYR